MATGVGAQQPYRAHLECPGGELPFGLELESDSAVLVNGIERIAVEDVRWDGRTLDLRIPVYDSRIEAEARPDGTLTGTWTKRHGPGRFTKMRFVATPGRAPRFEPSDRATRPAPELAGRWRVQFSEDDHPAVGIFEVDDDGTARGTFLTTLGDYRYLAGDARGGSLRLSCFDGAHAFLFDAAARDDGSLHGDFWSSDSWHETWSARRDPDAALPDPFTLTKAEAGEALAELAFPDLNGEPREIGDFLGKATLIQLFGTWCPNCNDASAWLAEVDRRYRDRGLRILGLAFEHTDDLERNALQVRAYTARHGCRYPVLLAGPSDKAAASRVFPVLDRVRAYPTTLFVDGAGRVRAVHTGFSGPATGPEHERLRDRFDALIEELLR